MRWWKRAPDAEEAVLIAAAMRLRMEIENLGSASPNKIDRAWAAVLADSLRSAATGWRKSTALGSAMPPEAWTFFAGLVSGIVGTAAFCRVWWR
jgi:hypothetical protein